ncbi:hypothetical protein CspHIS471_0411100 [Cutaneotrichosporon sp. HIS471]|nr:hypothetical protein CspHIS471_0411100 [Cutaneotrichosporon sp. HIS471]
MSLALSGMSPRTRGSKRVISVPAIDDAYMLVSPSVNHPNVADTQPNMTSPPTEPSITISDTKPPAITISPPSPQSVIRTCPPTPPISRLQARILLPAQSNLLAAPLPLRFRRRVFGSEGKERNKENSALMDAKEWQKRRDAKARGKLIIKELANLKVKHHSIVERNAKLLAQHTMLQDEYGVLEEQHDDVRDKLVSLQYKYKWLFREYSDMTHEQTKLRIIVRQQEKEIEQLKMFNEDQLALKNGKGKGKRKKRRDWAAWWAEWKRDMGFA